MDSLLLSILPTEKHTYKAYEAKQDPNTDHGIELACLQELITAFSTSAGFHIPTVRTAGICDYGRCCW